MSSSETGTLWELPGYIGELFTADPKQTPFLSAIGSLTGGGKLSDNFEFPVSVEYSLETAAQTTITEDDTVSAPDYDDHAGTQYKNVCEIHYKGVRVTYTKLGSMGNISGVTSRNMKPTIDDEVAFQIMAKLQEIARNVEFAMTQGTYQISTDADVANQMRGLIECASNASNTVAAGSAALSDDLIKEVIRTMYGNGAMFMDPVFIVNAFQAQQLSGLYGYAPQSREVGGLSLNQIVFDIAGTVGIMVSPHQPAATLTIADLGVCSPVFQQIPGKTPGIFYEEIAKDSATAKGMLYGHIGLDHGPYWAHGTITGLSTS